jgi:anti-sigma B factor antagonist
MTRTERLGPAPFSVDLHPERGRVLVSAAGELDLVAAPALEREIAELLDRGFTHVVVDLREVTFLDSTGIRVVLNANALATEHRARLSLILGGIAVRRPLELAGLLDHLDLLER